MTKAALQEGIDLYRTTAPLSLQGKEALHQLLLQNALVPLEKLEELGGTQELSPDLCRFIYTTYNTGKTDPLSNERCTQNIHADGQRFEEYGVPVITRVWEVGNRYVLLLVSEEGLGAPILFSSAYDIQTKAIHPIDVSDINALPASEMHYSKDAIHYFSRNLSDPDTECAGTELATFDLKTGTLTVQK